MLRDDEEYIAYSPDNYKHTYVDRPSEDDEDEFAYEKVLPKFKWNQFMNDYNSIDSSDVTFKRVKRDDEVVPPPEEEEPKPAETGGGGGRPDDSGDTKLFLTPIIGLTAFFALLFIVGPFLVRKGPNRGIIQCSIMLTAFCMWIFWVTVYIGQMNPLMGPRLENTTLAWMAVKVGHPVKPAATAGGAE